MPIFEIEKDGSRFQVEAGSYEQAIEALKNPAVESIPKQPINMPQDRMGGAGRFMEGAVMDPIMGTKQLYQHLIGTPEAAKESDTQVQQREQRLSDQGAGEDDLVRTAGRMVPSAALGAAAMPLGGIAGGAAGGALGEAMMPIADTNKFGEAKMNKMLLGTAFGGLGGGVAKVGGAIVGPTIREAAAELMKKGVKLTPGQIAGGIMRRAEEAAKDVPVLGSFIRGAEGRSIESFNRATIDMALEPIGVKLPASAAPGREAVSYAKLRLDDAYDNLLPKMQLTMDTNLASDIGNIRFLAAEMPKPQLEQFETILQNRLSNRFARNSGVLDGSTLKQVESELGKIGSQYRSSADAAQRELGHFVDETRFAVRDALERQNPAQAEELKKINKAYALFTRIEGAAGRRAGSEGVFTPADLLQAVKNADKSVRKGQFARGDALMQDFAEFANAVLPSKMPNSGTTEHAMWQLLAGAGAGGLLISPKVAAGMVGGVAPYTKIGQNVINATNQPGPTRQAIGGAISKSAAPAGAAATPALDDYVSDKKKKKPRSVLERHSRLDPSQLGAEQAPDGQYYLPDPERPGKYLQVNP